MIIQEFDWEKIIIKDPKRYLKVYDKKQLVEVHDLKSNIVWTRLDERRWMAIND